MQIRLARCLLISLTAALVNFPAAAAGFSGADGVSGTVGLPGTTEFYGQPAVKIKPEDESATSADDSVPGIDVPDVPAPAGEINDSIPGTANPRPDIWERIRSGFAMTELDGEESRHGEAFYANRPHYMKRIVERSKRYLFHIMEEVERRGMPAEIALIPIIESAFNPAANSHSHASGIWQLIPSTGKNYGLKQNWWYDERRDIIAATDAALNHLKKLYGMFGDWKLALASYNWGEGAIGRALVRNRNNGLPADFNNITLPPETRNFLQRLIAVKNIISNPAAFGIELVSIPDQPYFEKITATRHIDVQLAAKLANIPLDEFKALNPAHNRPVINADTVPTLLLPADKVEVFTENLKNHNEPLVSWQAYRAKKGETIEGIAAQYGIGPQRLKDINDIGGPGGITPGQTLLVPVNGSAGGEDISTMSDKPATLKLPERFFIYAVKKGDVLFNIAKRHGITVAQIKSWNRDTNRLSIGQKLILKQT